MVLFPVFLSVFRVVCRFRLFLGVFNHNKWHFVFLLCVSFLMLIAPAIDWVWMVSTYQVFLQHGLVSPPSPPPLLPPPLLSPPPPTHAHTHTRHCSERGVVKIDDYSAISEVNSLLDEVHFGYYHAYMATIMHTWLQSCGYYHAYMATIIHAWLLSCVCAWLLSCIRAWLLSCIHGYYHAYYHAYVATIMINILLDRGSLPSVVYGWVAEYLDS